MLAARVRPLDHLHVLVVDDNEHMVEIVKVLLRGFGVGRTLSALDGESGLALLRRTPVDVAIVEYQMRSMDGDMFVRQVRADSASPCQRIPIIMLTAHSERFRVEAARDAGVTEYCRKPVTAVDLYRKLQSVTQNHRRFVDVTAYHGPDRRRRREGSPAGADRRDGGKSVEYIEPQSSTEDRASR